MTHRALKVARGDWFVRSGHANGITRLVEPHLHRIIRCNVWHVRGRDRDLVVDTSVGVASVRAAMADLLDRPVVCVATHAHYDHVGCLHEFDSRLMHPAAAAQMDPYQPRLPLRWSTAGDEAIALARQAGYTVDRDEMLDALPSDDFDLDAFETQGVSVTEPVDEGNIVDLGDRRFEVLHLPGHTPGSIGLWEDATRTLFSGDAIYDGPLIDVLPESDTGAYIETMKRLKGIPVDVVHAGHDASFGQQRLISIADDYIESRSR